MNEKKHDTERKLFGISFYYLSKELEGSIDPFLARGNVIDAIIKLTNVSKEELVAMLLEIGIERSELYIERGKLQLQVNKLEFQIKKLKASAKKAPAKKTGRQKA